MCKSVLSCTCGTSTTIMLAYVIKFLTDNICLPLDLQCFTPPMRLYGDLTGSSAIDEFRHRCQSFVKIPSMVPCDVCVYWTTSPPFWLKDHFVTICFAPLCIASHWNVRFSAINVCHVSKLVEHLKLISDQRVGTNVECMGLRGLYS